MFKREKMNDRPPLAVKNKAPSLLVITSAILNRHYNRDMVTVVTFSSQFFIFLNVTPHVISFYFYNKQHPGAYGGWVGGWVGKVHSIRKIRTSHWAIQFLM